VEICHESVAVEAAQQVEIHGGLMYRRNLCTLLHLVDLLLDRRCLGRAVVVVVSFCSPFEQNVEKMNFVV
jgi:hypothetical protein